MSAAVVAMLIFFAGQQPATHAAPQNPATATAAELPVSLDRIQRALSAPAPLGTLSEQTPVFRLEIVGRKPTLEDLLGERFWIGPTPFGGMTHQEYLEMVTPKLAQPFGGFSGKYLLAQAALTLGETWALRQAISKFKSALTDRERDAARKEVVEALEALERARRQAGLPPR
jgi:hypothetical protein